MHPISDSKNGHATRVSIYRQFFNEINIDGFNFINGFKCSDIHRFEKLTKLSKNILELNFYQDQKNWEQKLVPLEISKIESDKGVDWLIFKNHYDFNKKLNVFLGKQDCRYIGKRCLNSHTIEDMINTQKQLCDLKGITSIRTSIESHLLWKNPFHKNPIYFRIYADFETDNEIDSSSIGNTTTIF